MEPERLLRYQGPFRTQGVLPLERGLRFLAPFPLAPGPLEGVEEGRFLGQALLPATPEGGVAEAWLGQDLRARLVREVALLSQGRRRPLTAWRPAWKTLTPTPSACSSPKPFPRASGWTSPARSSCRRGTASEAVLDPMEARSFRYRLTLPR